jgi:S1-C subfamily serine protease
MKNHAKSVLLVFAFVLPRLDAQSGAARTMADGMRNVNQLNEMMRTLNALQDGKTAGQTSAAPFGVVAPTNIPGGDPASALVGRAILGVQATFVAADLAEALHLPASGGFLVQGVFQGSAAAALGLRGARLVLTLGEYKLGIGGDLIVAIDGVTFNGPEGLVTVLSRYQPGDSVTMTVYRTGEQTDVSVTLGGVPAPQD